MTAGPDVIHLNAAGAAASIALRGAEPVSWRVGDRELLWSGDPAHWAYHAPLLFPVVGASAGGEVRVDGAAYPMPQHGFARTSNFALIDRGEDRARLRLVDDERTRAHYPFAFALEVIVRLEPAALELSFVVANTGDRPLPYGIGVHPAFPWPLDGPDRGRHRVRFERPERAEVPEVAAGGLLARKSRPVPLDGNVLPLAPELFKEALVFLDAESRRLAFEAPTNAAITLETEGFGHLAVWTKPTAPFLSLEAWTGHADWEDFGGELTERASTLLLAPGATGRHAVRMVWREPER